VNHSKLKVLHEFLNLVSQLAHLLLSEILFIITIYVLAQKNTGSFILCTESMFICTNDAFGSSDKNTHSHIHALTRCANSCSEVLKTVSHVETCLKIDGAVFVVHRCWMLNEYYQSTESKRTNW